MALVEIPAERIRQAAAKLPTPAASDETPFDKAIRIAGADNIDGGNCVVPSQFAERVAELLATPTTPTAEPKPTKAADKAATADKPAA